MIWNYYIVDVLGVETLIDDPVGWDNQAFDLKRDPEKHGIFFEYQANDFEFRGIAGTLLRREYEKNGIEGKMKLKIAYLCDEEDVVFFIGRIDFVSYESVKGEDCYIKVSVEMDSDVMTFVNRFDQRVNLETALAFDGTTPLTPYAKLPFVETLPAKSIFVEDLVENDNLIGEDWMDVNGDDIDQAAIFAPVLANVKIEEIGSLSFESSPISQANWSMPGGGSYVAPADWVALPYESETGSFGSDRNKIPLDSITPVLNYAEELGKTYGVLTNFNLEFDWSHTFSRNTVPSTAFVAVAVYGMATYGCIRKNSGAINWLPITYFGAFNPILPDTTSTGFVQGGTTNGFTLTLTLEPGDRLYLFTRVDFRKGSTALQMASPPFYISNPATVIVGPDKYNYFRYYGLSKLPDSTSKLFMINETCSRVVEAITDDKMRVYSDYLGRTDAEPYTSAADGEGSLMSLTTGSFIRKLEELRDTRPPLFNISMDDIWKGLNPIQNLGIGTEADPERPAGFNRVRIESWDYFYQDNVVFVCNNVDVVKSKNNSEEYYSLFKFGYDKWEAEEFNGIDEFLTKREYRTRLSEIKNTLSQISQFIASGFALEVTRRLGNKTSQDWKYDNETFIISMKRSGSDIIPEVGSVATPSNIVDPGTIYNFRLRPGYLALRWMPIVLASLRQAGINDDIVFTDGDGNYYADGELTTTHFPPAPNPFSEKDDISASLMTLPSKGLPKWYPVDDTFRFPMTIAEWNYVKSNPYGLIQYSTNDQIWYGWIRNIKFQPTEGTAEFTLIPKRS